MGVVKVSQAKSQFSRIYREAAEHMRVFKVANVQRRDAPPAYVVGGRMLERLLADLRLSASLEEDKEHGLWSACCPELDAVAQGETEREALHDLAEAIVASAEDYMSDPDFYAKVGRGEQLGYALKVIMCDDMDSVQQLLVVSRA